MALNKFIAERALFHFAAILLQVLAVCLALVAPTLSYVEFYAETVTCRLTPCSLYGALGPRTLEGIPDTCPDPNFVANFRQTFDAIVEGRNQFDEFAFRRQLSEADAAASRPAVLPSYLAGLEHDVRAGHSGVIDAWLRFRRPRQVMGVELSSAGRRLQAACDRSEFEERIQDQRQTLSSLLDEIFPTRVVDQYLGEILFRAEYYASAFLCGHQLSTNLGPCSGKTGVCDFVPDPSCLVTCAVTEVVPVYQAEQGDTPWSPACQQEILEDIRWWSFQARGFAHAMLCAPLVAIVITGICLRCPKRTVQEVNARVATMGALVVAWVVLALVCIPFFYAAWWVNSAINYYYGDYDPNAQHRGSLDLPANWVYQQTASTRFSRGLGLGTGVCAIAFHLLSQGMLTWRPLTKTQLDEYLGYKELPRENSKSAIKNANKPKPEVVVL